MEKKTLGGIAGVTAFLGALAGVVTAVHGSHSTTTAITRNDTKPVVINRPKDAHGSPLPVQVIQPSQGPPIVIVGHGAPCTEPSPTPTPTPTTSPTPVPTPTDGC